MGDSYGITYLKAETDFVYENISVCMGDIIEVRNNPSLCRKLVPEKAKLILPEHLDFWLQKSLEKTFCNLSERLRKTGATIPPAERT